MSTVSQHTEWLSLIDVSGPFLAIPVLERAFPQGLDVVETPQRQRLRQAYDEWRDSVDTGDPEFMAIHEVWLRLVLEELLEFDAEVMKPAIELPESLVYVAPEHGLTLKPDLAILSPDGDAAKPRLLITTYPPETDLEAVLPGDGWPASPAERMTLLCRATGVRLGLVTNGERWMLVDAPVGATAGYASWYARLWSHEPVTLRAFQSLLGVRRFFGPQDETLEALLESSLEHQEEVTDKLGEQVRRAVEVLVQALDRADIDRNRELLQDVTPSELYEAGLTVMMRLVFLLCAEERGLLLLGDSGYDQNYAISPLRAQLREEADRVGLEVLERRQDAWSRLLAVFRAVYGGIEHESLRMPALGGSLFDPDRFPFLEGRSKGTGWRETSAIPLPIDNHTVLMLLEALQVLEQRGGAQLLSYRALDVEQIGYVYEGLLEHTVVRVPRTTLGFVGSSKVKNPNVELAELESTSLEGEDALIETLVDGTGRSKSAIGKALRKPLEEDAYGRLLLACTGDRELADRIRPFAHLLRADNWGQPLVYKEASFAVTFGADRRETGTHYTPKSLTEAIVAETLEPVAYVGPAEGEARENWRLKPSEELLDLKICDPAMGSGAFLVQACRWLAERLLEAWQDEERSGRRLRIDGKAVDSLEGGEPLPRDAEERLLVARRLIAERCLYGVDINPMAVELAKLSIWLVTLAKGRPFGFLDHNLRSGDSLLGIHDLDQLRCLEIDPNRAGSGRKLFAQAIDRAVDEAVELRKRLRKRVILDIHDVEIMAELNEEARRKLELPELIADVLVGEVLAAGGKEVDTAALAIDVGQAIEGNDEAIDALRRKSRGKLSTDLPNGKPPRHPLHWPLEFPEVFERESGGFDAVVNNPPFLATSGGAGGSSPILKAYFQSIYSEVAAGAYDQANLFILLITRVLRDAGSYGVIMPQSNLSPGGADKLQECLNRTAVPNRFWIFENPKLFGGANVFICAISGNKGCLPKSARVAIMPRDTMSYERYDGAPSYAELDTKIAWWNWISIVRSGDYGAIAVGHQNNTKLFVDLSDIVDVFAGCATGVAYELSGLVSDESSGQGLKLVTTGAIDRYMCFWGVQEQRYLKKKYLFPRWPIAEDSPNSVKRAALRQSREKLIIGGLTKTLEVYLDRTGDLGGVVSTWVLIPRSKCVGSDSLGIIEVLKMLELILNSYCVSWMYSNNYGAQKSPWGGMTIKKDGVLSIRIPVMLFDGCDSEIQSHWDGDSPWDADISDPDNIFCCKAYLWECVRAINDARNCKQLLTISEIDKNAQKTIAWLYGYTKEKFDEMSAWFIEREKIDRDAIMRLSEMQGYPESAGYEEVIVCHEGAISNDPKNNTVSIKNQKSMRAYDIPSYSERDIPKAAEPPSPQMDIFSSQPDSQSTKKKGNQWGSEPIDQILAWLEAHPGWHTKQVILSGCQADPTGWDEVLGEIMGEGFVEVSQKGGELLYRAVE